MSKTRKIPTSVSETYGTSDIAQLCDVSPTTVAHWIDQGKIPFYSTPGGHRRVTRPNLIAFLEVYKFPLDPEIEKWLLNGRS